MNIQKMPKVELHLHLDGSINLKTACKLASKMEDEIHDKLVAPNKCLDLRDYLTRFYLPDKILQTKESLEMISKDLIESLIKDNVIYAEVRFAPLSHVKKLSLEEVIESVLNGLKSDKVKTNLILCMRRNNKYKDNIKVINLAKKYLNKGVAAVDLVGDEYNYPTKNYKKLFAYATSLNVPFTIHAGETGNIDDINNALDFGTLRLGHGIKCLNDINTLERIKNNNITLEICPTSNVQTNAIDEYKNHPIKRLFDFGIKVTINTDNRTVSNITLVEEYEKLMNEFKFSLQDFIDMNINAINASFLNESERQELLNKYLKYIKE